MDYDKVTVRISPASEEGCHEFVTSGQIGHYGFRDVIRLVATTKAGSDFLSADVAGHFLVTLRNTIIESLGCTITRYVSENDLPYYQIAKSSKPQHRILLDSSRYNQQQNLAPVVKSFGRKKNLESSNSLMQKILHYASSEFTLAFGAWKCGFNVGSLDIQLHVQSDLYDIRTSQFVKQNRRRAWAFERTITRKMEQDLEQQVRGPVKRYKGVRWRPERKHPWVAEIKISEKRKLWIGDFDTPEEAAQAFDVAAISHKKKTALNFEDSLVRATEVVEQFPSSSSNKPFDITYNDAPPINVAAIFHRRKRPVNQLEASLMPKNRSLDQPSSFGQPLDITHDDEETTSNTEDPPILVPSKSLKPPCLAEQRAHAKFAGVHHNELEAAISFFTSNLDASDAVLGSSSLVQLSAYEESEPLDSRSYDNIGAIPHRKEMMTANWENSSLSIPKFLEEQLLGEGSDASTTSDMFFDMLGDPRVAGSCGQLLDITHDDEVAAVCHKQGTTSNVDEDPPPPILVPSKSLKPPFLAKQRSDAKFAGVYHNDLQAEISFFTSNLDGSSSILESSSQVQLSGYEEQPMEQQPASSMKNLGEANDMCFGVFGDPRVAGSSGQHLDITHDGEVAAICQKQGTTSNVDEDPPILVPSKSWKPPFLAELHSDVKFGGVHNELEVAISFFTSMLESGEEPVDSRSYGNVGAISHRKEMMTVNWENSSSSVPSALSEQPLTIASDIMCFDMLGDPRVASSSVTHYNSSNEETSSSTMPSWPVHHDNLFDSLEFHDIFLNPHDFIQADSAGIHEDDRTSMSWMLPIASPDESHNVQGLVAPFQGIGGDLHDFLSPSEIDQGKDTDQRNQ